MRKLIALGVALCLTAQFCRGGADEDTRLALERTIDKGVAILKDKAICDQDKLKAFDTLLLQNCHTELMAMLSLGRAGWMTLDKKQRDEFVKAFLGVITRSYYNKLSQVDVSHFAVDYLDNIKLSDTRRTIRTVMKNTGDGFKVDYKFALRGKNWAIYDIEVEGISLIASYRSQFADFIKNSSASALLSELQNNNRRFEAEAVQQQ
jgi:phospholipid transport system substrate-binding protein